MYRPRGHHNGGSNVSVPAISSPEAAQATDVLEKFIAASTFKSVLHHHRQICDLLKLHPTNIRQFYPKLRAKLKSWKAQALWAKFDKRASHKCYNHGKACANTKVLIIGSGPCGMRTAIEAQLLGAQVVVVEKRDRFSRNNVLHLWPFVITDLKALGAKKFYGKFCAGSIDHISIRQLQCILLKVALLLGVRVFEGLGFEELLPPPQDQTEKIGWRARFSQPEHSLHQYEFDVLIGADGKRNTLAGFKRTEFRGKLAIAVTANFINKRSEGESSVQEISGVAFIFNQKFFKELRSATGIDLENIVYYKDETHYFVMTAKKQSLIDKRVIIEDLMDTQQLLHPNNVNREALQNYAREAADFSTNYQMPHLDFAVNHYGHPDVAMFDFTSMFAAENACRAHQVHGHRLLMGLVGDSLLEPFWPTGSGCARGFLSAFDAAWMMRSWAMAGGTGNPLDVLAERESIYRLLAQTTPRNLSKDLTSYTLEPCSRYPTINTRAVLPFQVRQLFTTDDPASLAALLACDLPSSALPVGRQDASDELPRKRKRRDSLVDPGALLNWCQRQVSHLPSLSIDNMTTSFKDGLALCGILHRYRPEVVPFKELLPNNGALNNQLAFDILETEFGVPPLMTGAELSEGSEPDKLSMISYLSQIHHVLRGEVPHVRYEQDDGDVLEEPDALPASCGTRGITCRVRDEPLLAAPIYDRNKKYKTERGITPEAAEAARLRQEEIAANRTDRLARQRQQRELDTVRFVRSMRLLHGTDLARQPESDLLSGRSPASYNPYDDEGLKQYRKEAMLSMRQKARELEKRIYFTGGAEPPSAPFSCRVGATAVDREDFDDRVKYLEAKFKGEPHQQRLVRNDKKPKDMVRAIGRLEKGDWNVAAIERKIEENPRSAVSGDAEKVPHWNKQAYEEKMNTIERRLRANGEKEETIAKYKDVDAYLKRLEKKLREGSTLDVGLKGNNKVSNLASQLSSKLTHPNTQEKVKMTGGAGSKAPVVVQLPTTSSDLCYFCGTRVYLVERLSAEGKFFHRHCFKCHYCNALLRLGNYIYDREGRYGGKFFCSPHFGLTVSAGQRRGPLTTSALTAALGGTRGGMAMETPTPSSRHVLTKLSGGAVRADMVDRGTTPERVEFENSLVEQGTDEDYLSEEEWTDRNFGASANELDDTSNDSEDDSDSEEEDAVDGDEEEEGQEEAIIVGGGRKRAGSIKPTAVTNWKAGQGCSFVQDSDSDLDSDDYSEEYGAEGDESHTATEGEGEEDEDDDGGGEEERRQRERRKQEIQHTAPPKRDDTSDTASDTEIGSDDSESDTQIDTDSEFGEEDELKGWQREIPTIIIDGEEEGVTGGQSASPRGKKTAPSVSGSPREGAEKSASLTSLAELSRSPPQSAVSPVDQLRQRLLMRTESNEALTSQKNLLLRRQYLLGQGSSLPKKSVSTADFGNTFKSAMEKISETQKKLHPAAQPSPAMQAYINSSSAKTSPVVLSPQSPVAAAGRVQSNAHSPIAARVTPLTETGLIKAIDNEITPKPELIPLDVEAENFRNFTLTRSISTPNNKPNNETEHDKSPENDSTINFGERDCSEADSKPCKDTNNGILLIDSSNPDQSINRLDFIMTNADSAVETINEELLRRSCAGTTEFGYVEHSNNNSPYQRVESSPGHLSLQSAQSVASDVDDLFEILARDAQDDTGNFLSFNSAMEEVAPSLAPGKHPATSSSTSHDLIHQTYGEEKTAHSSHMHFLQNDVPQSDKGCLSPPVSSHFTEDNDVSLQVDSTTPTVLSNSPEPAASTELRHSTLNPQLVESSNESSVEIPFDRNSVISQQGTLAEVQENPSVKTREQRAVARVASIESLGDTDSAMSLAPLGADGQRMPRLPPGPPPLEEEDGLGTKAPEVKASNTLSEMDAIEFMDSDEEGASDARQRNSLALSAELPGTQQYPVPEIPLNDATESLNDSSCTPSKETSPKGEFSYQNIVNQTLDSMSPVSTPDDMDASPRSTHYTPLADTVSSSTEDSSYSGSAPGFTSTPVRYDKKSLTPLSRETKTGDDGLGCSSTASPDNVLLDKQESLSMDESLGSETILPTLSTKSPPCPVADRRSRLRQGSGSSPSDDVNKTDNSSGHTNTGSSESKEGSSLSQVSSPSHSSSDGSKEALLSSPELVKNVVYHTDQSALLSRTELSNNSSELADNTPMQENKARSSPIAEKKKLVSPTKRYEGYIPRFKDHITPFTRIRDTLDIRKENRYPSSSPSKEETKSLLDERSITADSGVVSGATPDSGSVSTTLSDTFSPPQFTKADNAPALRKIEKNVLNTKKKDGDVVQQLVLSRISRKTPDKFNKRSSRLTLSPLNSSENLLDSKNNITSSCERSSDSNLLKHINGDPTSSCTPGLDRSTTSLSERVLVEPSQRYTPKFSQYSPIEARIGRTRANTVSAITRDSKTLSLVNLPATPLTHPHQFQNIGIGPKKLFASPAPSESISIGAQSNGFNSIGSQLPAATTNQSVHRVVDAAPVSAIISGLDLERSQAREKARSLAKLKSDFDLGLCPPHVPPAVVTRLDLGEECKEHSIGEDSSVDKTASQSNSRERNVAQNQSTRYAESEAQNQSTTYAESEAHLELAVLSDRAKEERVRKLLAEQRARDLEARQHHARENRDEKVAEKLHQFRVRKDKKSQALPPNTAAADNEDNSVRQLTSRPSLLELESMQVFSKPQPALAAVFPVASCRDRKPRHSPGAQEPLTSPSMQGADRAAAPHTANASHARSLPSASAVTPPLSTSTPLASSPPPLTPSQIYGSKSPSPPKASSVKHKSKDRERRRSLIQVFAGMFKLSGAGEERRDSGSPSSSGASSPPSLSAPKSPATAVRDKLARLRLPRTRDSKGGKKRSSSSEVLAEPANKDARLVLSLPTSPAHHITAHSPLPLIFAVPPHASGPRSVAAGHPSPPHDTPRIEEESLTDDESSSRTALRSPHRPALQHRPAADTSREAELKRLRQAQEIQRQLEECEVKTRDLEERGVLVEKSLRGEPGGEHREETDLMSEWFRLVHEKNGLARWEQELSIRARELELEDRDARLQQQLACRGGTIVEERELLSIREQREHLRAMLEEDRLRYVEEDRDLECVMLRKGLPLPPIRRETGV